MVEPRGYSFGPRLPEPETITELSVLAKALLHTIKSNKPSLESPVLKSNWITIALHYSDQVLDVRPDPHTQTLGVTLRDGGLMVFDVDGRLVMESGVMRIGPNTVDLILLYQYDTGGYCTKINQLIWPADKPDAIRTASADIFYSEPSIRGGRRFLLRVDIYDFQ